jgi:hypothetical protein
MNFFIPIICIIYILKFITSKWVSFNNFIIYKTMWQLEWHPSSKKMHYAISKLVHPTMHPTMNVLSCLFSSFINNFSCILWINSYLSFSEFFWDQCRSTLSSLKMGSHFWWMLESKLELVSFPIQFVVKGVVFFKVMHMKEMSHSNWHHRN